jgi:hypothetical protein
MGALIRTIARTGIRRGLGGGAGGRGWLAIGLAAGTIQFLRRKSGEPKVTSVTKLEPGQSLVITHMRKGEAKPT